MPHWELVIKIKKNTYYCKGTVYLPIRTDRAKIQHLSTPICVPKIFSSGRAFFMQQRFLDTKAPVNERTQADLAVFLLWLEFTPQTIEDTEKSHTGLFVRNAFRCDSI
jgi:hypothetical protein